MPIMIISIGSTNAAKVAACKTIFKEAFKYTTEFRSYDVPSGIDAMPMSNDQSVQGALNRARAALAIDADAEIGVGLEGGAYEGPLNKLFLLGWVAVVNKDGTMGIGHSGGAVLPDAIANELRNGAELGPLMHKRTKVDIRHTIGTTGLLTAGLYPRNREFEDALRNALAVFVAPEQYNT